MISAVSFAHTLNGFSSPSTDPAFSLVLKGIKKKTFVPPKRALPFTTLTVKQLVEGLIGEDMERDSFYNVELIDWRTAAQSVLCFSALARFDCLTKLNPSHLVFGDAALIIHFPRSKTDQLGEGNDVSVHRSGGDFCPVRFMESYLRRLSWEYQLEAPSRAYTGPLFPALTVRKIATRFGDAVTSLPVNPSAFSRSAATIALRKGLEKTGIANAAAFTLHSGRRGGASAAVAAGCDMLTLKRQGRWKSDSCPQLYVDNHVSINLDFTKFLSM